MTIRAALTRLASLSVSGVSHNYDVDSVPDTLNRVQLPALLVLPITPSTSKIARTASEGFQTIAFGGSLSFHYFQ